MLKRMQGVREGEGTAAAVEVLCQYAAPVMEVVAIGFGDVVVTSCGDRGDDDPGSDEGEIIL